MTDTKYPDSSASCKALADQIAWNARQFRMYGNVTDADIFDEVARILRDVVPAMHQYMQHLPACEWHKFDQGRRYTCNCGLQAALDALEKDDG